MTAPNDLAAEQAVIAGCMLSSDVAVEVLETLRPDDFFTPRHTVIFQAIMVLALNGHPTDTIAVVDELIRRGELHQAGGADYVHSLTTAIPVASQAHYYADIVNDRAVRRRVLAIATTITSSIESGSAEELLAQARTRLDQAAGLQKQSLSYVGDLIEEVVSEAEQQRTIYPSPWPGLNEILGGGFRPGALYVVAARPGIGKSAAALQMAASLAEHGPVAFSSLEMPKKELVRRIIAQGVNMPHSLLEAGRPLPELWRARIEDWLGVAPHSIAISDNASMNAAGVRAFARAVQRPAGRIAGVVVDYLQLMPGLPGMPRQEVVAENARQHKLLAMELDCPVILLSQLNRNPEARIDKRPMLSDLRESGAIEQDADVVMLMYRDPDFEQAPMNAPPLPVPVEINVAKNRHGPTMVQHLNWEGSQMRLF